MRECKILIGQLFQECKRAHKTKNRKLAYDSTMEALLDTSSIMNTPGKTAETGTSVTSYSPDTSENEGDASVKEDDATSKQGDESTDFTLKF